MIMYYRENIQAYTILFKQTFVISNQCLLLLLLPEGHANKASCADSRKYKTEDEHHHYPFTWQAARDRLRYLSIIQHDSSEYVVQADCAWRRYTEL